MMEGFSDGGNSDVSSWANINFKKIVLIFFVVISVVFIVYFIQLKVSRESEKNLGNTMIEGTPMVKILPPLEVTSEAEVTIQAKATTQAEVTLYVTSTVEPDCLSDYMVSKTFEKRTDLRVNRRYRISTKKANFFTNTLCECELLCENEDKCRAFTYFFNLRRKNCILKGVLTRSKNEFADGFDVIFAEKKFHD